MYTCVHMYENACRRAEEGGRFHETGTKDGCVGVGTGVWVLGWVCGCLVLCKSSESF